MPKKPLTSLIVLPEPDEVEVVHIGSSAAKPRKSFTNKRATSADQINAWSTAEIHAGSYYPDQQDAIRKAITSGLKAEKLG